MKIYQFFRLVVINVHNWNNLYLQIIFSEAFALDLFTEGN
jgi:hypothetical protein